MTDMSPPRTEFRQDINGLRAWAVVAVVLYHFGVPGFGGGYVGVDIFFVLSGFLMTGIVVNGLERGSFSVWGFYMARARRIVPALVVLCAVLMALGWFALLPPDYQMLGKHVFAALGFFSNLSFFGEAGYFDAGAYDKWLLHTWSLSVEWQFYLLLPLAAWAVWRWRPGRPAQLGLILVAGFLSLALCVIATPFKPIASFYFLPTRAWEMLAGGAVFMLSGRWPLSARQRQAIETLGLALIVTAIAAFDVASAWPGWRAAVPVAATVMVLWAQSRSPWTGNAAAQWLGDRSYSLYLWHWPVVVALAYLELQHSALAIVAALALTLALGHLSYHQVEVRARRWLAQARPHQGLAGLIAAVVLVAGTGELARRLDGIGGRFASEVDIAANEERNINPRRGECLVQSGARSPQCLYGGPQLAVIALGDSHVNALVTGLAAALPGPGMGAMELSYRACPYLPGMQHLPAKRVQFGDSYQCTEFTDAARAHIATLPGGPDGVPVVMMARYARAAFSSNDGDAIDGMPEVYFSKIHATPTPEFLAEFSQHFVNGVCAMSAQRPVYLLRPIPEMRVNVPQRLARKMAFGAGREVTIPIDSYWRRNRWVWDMQDAARDRCGARILDPLPLLCRDGRCFGSQEGRPLYSDHGHLSEWGNKLLQPMFAQVFAGPAMAAWGADAARGTVATPPKPLAPLARP